MDGGERGGGEGGGSDVVKADDGDVAGDVEAGVFDGADCAHGLLVSLKRKECCEVAVLLEQGAGGIVGDLRVHGVLASLERPAALIKMDDEGGIGAQA